MQLSKHFWIRLTLLVGVLMGVLVLAFFAGSGGVFLRKLLSNLREHKEVPQIAWVGVLVILSAVGASASLLFGLISRRIGNSRTGTRSLILGSIFQWLFFTSGLIFHWYLAVGRRIQDASLLWLIPFFAAIIVSLGAYQSQQSVSDSLMETK